MFDAPTNRQNPLKKSLLNTFAVTLLLSLLTLLPDSPTVSPWESCRLDTKQKRLQPLLYSMALHLSLSQVSISVSIFNANAIAASFIFSSLSLIIVSSISIKTRAKRKCFCSHTQWDWKSPLRSVISQSENESEKVTGKKNDSTCHNFDLTIFFPSQPSS